MNEEVRSLAQALRQARLDAGLSQSEAVARLRVPRKREWLSQVESGKTRVSWALMQELADIYNVPYGWLESLRRNEQGMVPLVAIPFFSSGQVSASLLKEGATQVGEQVYWQRDPNVPANYRVFGVRAIGGCLAPRIEEGDILHVDLDATPTEGDVVFLDLEGEANVKQFRRRVRAAHGRELWVLTSNDGDVEVEPMQVRGVVLSAQKQIRRNA